MNKRKLVLEDGKTFIGTAFGSDTIRFGEVIFYAGMTGYQEVITDPSYYGKMLVMTYPSIGNYGINRDDFEAIIPFISGMIVKEVSNTPSNFRSMETLDVFLKKYNIPGISGIDTRMLTRLIRRQGTMRAVLVDEIDPEPAKHFETLEISSILSDVSIEKPYIIPGSGKRVTVVDFGMKQSILHELMARNCHITVVPYHYPYEEIVNLHPDGILLSGGPGNPADMDDIVTTVKNLIGKFPLFGIGLGHQLLALAYGAKTNKLFTGKYGAQFPVKTLANDTTGLTTNSHDFYIEEASLAQTPLQITHRTLDDGLVAGMKVVDDAMLSVQFHPEGAPGSNEMNEVFDQFIENIEHVQLNNGGTYHA